MFLLSTKKQNKVGTIDLHPPAPTTHCYERTVTATQSAPYTVHETMKLTFDGSAITGTKSGTQSGPDMTNGYTGTLSGTIDTGKQIPLLYTYTVEGSTQQEKELYVLNGSEIIKQRYPLLDKNGVLIPDTTQPFVDQVYTEISC